MLKCFDTLKKSLEAQRKAEYKLNNLLQQTIVNCGLLGFGQAKIFSHIKEKFKNTKRSLVSTE